MADDISVVIQEESLAVQMSGENTISVVLSGGATWDGISGKPSAAVENSFMVSNAASGWGSKTLAEAIALINAPVPVQIAQFAIPLTFDVTTYKDWKCSNVSGATTVNVSGESDGAAGMIELFNSVASVITLGTMFTKNVGGGTVSSGVSGYNVIAWMKSGADILYQISQAV